MLREGLPAADTQEEDGKAYVDPVGSALEHKDGEVFSVLLDGVPVDGRVQRRFHVRRYRKRAAVRHAGKLVEVVGQPGAPKLRRDLRDDLMVPDGEPAARPAGRVCLRLGRKAAR